jgi:hypothetical protein
VNDDANLPTNALEEDEYLLADISQTKWEMPHQWPTTSSEEESAQFGLENNGNGGDDHGILWTTQRLGKLLPFQAVIKRVGWGKAFKQTSPVFQVFVNN